MLDLSCRQRDGQYFVVTDRWQRFSSLSLSEASLAALAASCDEFLVHGVDVEGMQLGIDDKLVELLGEWSPIPVTYAGGARTLVSGATQQSWAAMARQGVAAAGAVLVLRCMAVACWAADGCVACAAPSEGMAGRSADNKRCLLWHFAPCLLCCRRIWSVLQQLARGVWISPLAVHWTSLVASWHTLMSCSGTSSNNRQSRCNTTWLSPTPSSCSFPPVCTTARLITCQPYWLAAASYQKNTHPCPQAAPVAASSRSCSCWRQSSRAVAHDAGAFSDPRQTQKQPCCRPAPTTHRSTCTHSPGHLCNPRMCLPSQQMGDGQHPHPAPSLFVLAGCVSSRPGARGRGSTWLQTTCHPAGNGSHMGQARGSSSQHATGWGSATCRVWVKAMGLLLTLITGQPPWRECRSLVLPSGCRDQNSSAAPFRGLTARPLRPHSAAAHAAAMAQVTASPGSTLRGWQTVLCSAS